MKKRIVEQTIKGLKPPATGNRIAWDSEIPGFGARITAAGIISFILDYRIFGRQRRYTIGRYPEITATAARIDAGELRAKIRAGHDPMEERLQRRSEPTLGDLATEYLESARLRSKRPNTVRDYTRMIDKIVRPRARQPSAQGDRPARRRGPSWDAQRYSVPGEPRARSAVVDVQLGDRGEVDH